MKFLTFALAAACTVLVLTSPTASAAFITYSGTTLGCFGAGCTPVAGVTQDGTDGLFFTPNQNPGFKCTTDATGFCAVGDSAPANGQVQGLANGDNLGYFTLYDTTSQFNGDPFTLRVVFTTPNVTAGNPATFAATLTGTVTSGSVLGGVRVNFTNTVATLTGSCSSGPCVFPGFTPIPNGTPYQFTLTIPNSLNITPPANTGQITSNLSVTGNIQDQQATPEPGTSMLLGSTLVLGALMMRRLRRS